MFAIFLLLSHLVAAYPNNVPALDIIPTKGDSRPIINVKLGYPRKHYMKMALDLNYETSWLFATRKCRTPKCAQQCYQTAQSETLTNYTTKQQKIDSKWTFFGKDLVTLRNGREYHMSFGLTETTCINKYWPYSGVLSLAPQNIQFSNQFLSQFNSRIVSFFVPSARSRMQQGTLVFGTSMHPGCSYRYGTNRVFRFFKEDGLLFQSSRIEIRNDVNSTYTDYLAQQLWLTTDVEGLYVPEQYAQVIYKLFKVTSANHTDTYYKECAQIENNDVIAFFIGGNEYQLEAKYLFTPVNKNLCKLNIHIGDSSTNNWILGKQFMERFCVTLNYADSTLMLGLVSEKRKL